MQFSRNALDLFFDETVVAIPYALVKIAHIRILYNPLYPFNDYWLTLTEWAFPVAAVLCILLIIYQWITGFLYRKQNHIKYFYHYALAQFISILPAIVGFHLAAMLFLPEVFQGFRLVATPLLSFALIYQLYREVQATCKLLEGGELAVKQKHFETIYKKLLWISFVLLPFGVFFRFGSGIEFRDLAMSVITPMFFVLSFFLSKILISMALNQYLRAFYLLKYPEAFRIKAAKNPYDWYGYRCMKNTWVCRRLSTQELRDYKLGQAYEEKALDAYFVRNEERKSEKEISHKSFNLKLLAFLPTLFLACLFAFFLLVTIFSIIKGVGEQGIVYVFSKEAYIPVFLLILLFMFMLLQLLWRKNSFGFSLVSRRIRPQLLRKIQAEEAFITYTDTPGLGISESYLLSQSSLGNGRLYPLTDIAALEIISISDDSAFLYVYFKDGKSESFLFLSQSSCIEVARQLQNKSEAKLISHLSDLQFVDWQNDYKKSVKKGFE